MRVVSINKYQVIYYDRKSQLMKCEWLEDTNAMSLQKFRKEAERILNFSIKLKPVVIVVDLSNFKYDLDVTDANWFNAIHKMDIVKKVAIIITYTNQQLFNQISTFIKSNSILIKKTQVYQSEFEALEWLDVSLV